MSGPTPLPAQVRTYLSSPGLAAIWAAVRSRLQRTQLSISGAVSLDVDEVTANLLSGLLGRSVPTGPSRRVKLDELDAALRRSAAGQGLISMLEALDGRPLIDRVAARRDDAAQWAVVWQHLDACLAAADLAEAGWVPDWIAGLRRTGILTRAGSEAATKAISHAVAALGVLAQSSAPALRSPVRGPDPALDRPSWELAVLASQVTGDAHGLDDSRLSAAVLLRAAALALRVPEPAADRRKLWHALGVATDTLSSTVLVWGLRSPGRDGWSAMMRERSDLGLVTHLTLHELERTGVVALVEAGQLVSVCENPQVLQAAMHAGVGRPLICLSGNPATVGVRLLRRLVAGGNLVRYHGDFDWPGVAIAGRVMAEGVVPWRLSAADYRRAVVTLDSDHAVLLSGREVPTPWDPELAGAMSASGLAVHEESVLDDLIADLDGAGVRP